MKVYGIGGLGADERVFSELEFDFEFVPLPWIEPEHNEPLQDYARRFSDQINLSTPFSIIGVSFGGMLALELARTISIQKTILVSSASSKQDIPNAFRAIGKTGIVNFLPLEMIRPPAFVSNWLFGVNSAKGRKLLASIMADTSPRFLRWALSEILVWDHDENSNNHYRIHGSSDRLLNCTNYEDAHIIEDGGHFMIVERAQEVSAILNKILLA